MAREFVPIGSGNGRPTSSAIHRYHRRSPSLETFDERIVRFSGYGLCSSNSLIREGRTMTFRPPAKDDSLTLRDRLISALLCGLWGFATMVFVWVIAFNSVFVPMNDAVWTLCTWTTWMASGAAAALGLFLRPERMMDGFAKVWDVIDHWLRGDDR
jgi:hypothetical protein